MTPAKKEISKEKKPAAKKRAAAKTHADDAAVVPASSVIPAKAGNQEAHHSGSYFYAVGRRKSGIAQVRLYPAGKGTITVNDRPMKEYLPVEDLQDAVLRPLKAVGMEQTVDITVHSRGGGIRGQADAIKLGIARALLLVNPDLRATLKPLGMMTRDPREKERKKYGLKKARKAPQWAKR